MSIGTPVQLGSTSSGPALTLVLVTTADSPAGNTIVAMVSSIGLNNITGVTDSAGNTYAHGTALSNGAGTSKQNIYYCINALHLPVGGMVTASYQAAVGGNLLGVDSIPGITAVDQTPVGVSGTGTITNATTALMAQYGELTYAQVCIANGASDSGYLEDGSFIPSGVVNNTSAMHWSYNQSNSRFAVAYSSTLGLSGNWGVKLLVFKGVPPPLPQRRMFSRGTGVKINPIPPTLKTKWGYFNSSSTAVALITTGLLGATVVRMSCDNTQGPLNGATSSNQIKAAGKNAMIGFNNVNSGLGISVPPPDLGVYQQQLAAQFDNLQPTAPIVIQNEEEGGYFYQTQPGDGTPQGKANATASAYMGQLQKAVEVAHSTGAYAGPLGIGPNGLPRSYKITNGGLSFTGICLAHWYYLWNNNRRADADAFAAICLSKIGLVYSDYTRDLPNVANPTRPILATHANAFQTMLTCTAMLPLYKATGIDYINVHCYGDQPDLEQYIRALAWVGAMTGLPLVSNEFGQRNTDPLTTTACASIAVFLRMAYFVWYGAPNPNERAEPIANADGSLNSQGTAYAALISTYS